MGNLEETYLKVLVFCIIKNSYVRIVLQRYPYGSKKDQHSGRWRAIDGGWSSHRWGLVESFNKNSVS